MPLYEFECAKCEKVHEVMQKFSDAPLAECPDCQGPVKKLMSMSSFSLKGTGWYTTDYKRAKPPIAPAKGGEAKTESKTESKGESTPAAPPAAQPSAASAPSASKS